MYFQNNHYNVIPLTVVKIMTTICTNQTSIIQTLVKLNDMSPIAELCNELIHYEIDGIHKCHDELVSKTTKSRRMGKFYSVGDYFFYFANNNDTILIILSKLGIRGSQLAKLCKLTIRVNSQLYKSDETKKWFSRNDDYQHLKLQEDTLITIPFAHPDPYTVIKRPAIPKNIRREVWERDGNKCYVCETKLEYSGWDCAHVTPWIVCKEHRIGNLRVTCSHCNRTCGVQNLDDFKDVCSKL